MNTDPEPETPESLRSLAKNKETIANMKFPFLSKMLTKEAAKLRARADELERAQNRERHIAECSHTTDHGICLECGMRCDTNADDYGTIPVQPTAATAEQERFYAPLIERSTAEQAGKPTAGAWHTGGTFTPDINPRQNVWGSTPKGCQSGTLICERAKPLDAALVAEAGTVYHETGLTPRQLAAQRASAIRQMDDAKVEVARLRRMVSADEIKVDAYLGVCDQLNEAKAEIARLKEGLAASESTLKFACHEWAKDNTSIRAIAEQFRIVTDDKSGYFIPRKQVMQEMSDKFTALTRERDALLVALEKCADDIDAWSTVLADEWPNFDGQLYPASNVARAAIANARKGTASAPDDAAASYHWLNLFDHFWRVSELLKTERFKNRLTEAVDHLRAVEARGSVPAEDPAPKCPKCGSEELHRRHHAATFALPECDTTACGDCDWVSEPS